MAWQYRVSGRIGSSRRGIRVEGLEARVLLALTADEYASIRSTYASFGLPADITQLNIIEITPDQLDVTALQNAVRTAGDTALPDLVVLRTTDTQNTITYTVRNDTVGIDIPATKGAITIVGFGSEPLTVDAANQCGVIFVGSLSSTTTVNLGGMRLIHGDTLLGSGGGIHQLFGTLALTDVTISGNRASYGSGGGIYQFHGTSTLTNVTIVGNTASGSGGGMYLHEAASTLTNVTISGNSASFGGGVYQVGTTLTLTRGTISGNTVEYFGGGVYQHYGASALTDVRISGNTARADGGGVYEWQGISALTNVVISGNTSSHAGGGIYESQGSATLTNVTITGNVAATGGGIQEDSGTSELSNTVVARNAADTGPDIYTYPYGTLSGANNLIGDAATMASLVNGIDGNLVGTQASPIDPRFVSTAGADWTLWDLRLQSDSPAVDGGSNALVPSGITVDLAGRQRFIGAAVDMGAHESGVPSAPTATILSPATIQARRGVGTLVGTFTSTDPDFRPNPLSPHHLPHPTPSSKNLRSWVLIHNPFCQFGSCSGATQSPWKPLRPE